MRFSLFTTAVAMFALAGLSEAIQLQPINDLAQKDKESSVAAATQAIDKQVNDANEQRASKVLEESKKQTMVVDGLRKGIVALQEAKVQAVEKTKGLGDLVKPKKVEEVKKVEAKPVVKPIVQKVVKKEAPKDLSTCLNDCLQNALKGTTAATPAATATTPATPATAATAAGAAKAAPSTSDAVATKAATVATDAATVATKAATAAANAATVAVKKTPAAPATEEKKVVEAMKANGTISPDRADKVTKKLDEVTSVTANPAQLKEINKATSTFMEKVNALNNGGEKSQASKMVAGDLKSIQDSAAKFKQTVQQINENTAKQAANDFKKVIKTETVVAAPQKEQTATGPSPAVVVPVQAPVATAASPVAAEASVKKMAATAVVEKAAKAAITKLTQVASETSEDTKNTAVGPVVVKTSQDAVVKPKTVGADKVTFDVVVKK